MDEQVGMQADPPMAPLVKHEAAVENKPALAVTSTPEAKPRLHEIADLEQTPQAPAIPPAEEKPSVLTTTPTNVAPKQASKPSQDSQPGIDSSAANADMDGTESDTEYDDPWFDAACLSAIETQTYEDVISASANVAAAENKASTEDLSAIQGVESKVEQSIKDEEMALDDESHYHQDYELPAELRSGGFSTAKGNALPTISEAAQTRAKRLFEEVDQGLPVAEDGEADEDALAAALQEAKKQKGNINKTESTSAPPPPIMSLGFATASKKALPPPSEKARQRAALLFQQAEADLAAEEDGPTPLKPQMDAATASSARTLVDTPSRPGPARQSLFTTGGGGKPMEISEAARKRALELFADIDAEPPTASPTAQKIPPRSRMRSCDAGFNKSAPGHMQDNSNAKPAVIQLGSMKPRPATTGSAAPFTTPMRPRIPSGISSAHIGSQTSPAESPLGRRPGMGIQQRSQATLNKRAPFNSPFKTPQAKVKPSAKKGLVRMESSTPRVCFDLKSGTPRKTLAQTVIMPGQFRKGDPGTEHLPDEIWAVDATNALYYHFASPDGIELDARRAFERLVGDGWTHASQKWVDEHWAQILWKLASEIRAAPRLFEERWTFKEVMRQLRYRYEREINRAQRSAIQRIQEQDSPAAMAMVLFVYAIEKNTHRNEAGGEKTSYSIQLSDGWYRINAGADAPLTRAIERGKLRVGSKVAVSGARLDAPKEGIEVLSALNKSSLIISGNSTCLAPWDARLGYSLTPHIATIASLTGDGGLTPMLCVKVTRVYPLAYFDAKSKDSPPWSHEEEERMQEQWLNKMGEERQRLMQGLERGMAALEEDLAIMQSMLEGVDTSKVIDTDDIQERYEATANKPAFIRSLDASCLFNLWQSATKEIERLRIQGMDDLEKDLRKICPPRDVRSFQVIRFEDAIRSARQPASRIDGAQLQIWEAKDKAFKEVDQGATFLISNLMPWKSGAWYSTKDAREVFLQTRRDSRFKRVV